MAEGGTSAPRPATETDRPPARRESFNTDLLNRIPVDARTLLHVGCGTGGLGAAFLRINPRARVLGMEPDSAKASAAANRIDEVAAADPERDSVPFALPHGIDCLIVEGLAEWRNPVVRLRRFAQHVAADGVILAPVPNAEHWRVVAKLLQGGAEPDSAEPRGLTRDAARQMFEQAGFGAIEIAPKIVEADLAASFVGSITTALIALGVEPAEYLRRASPLEFVVQARRRAPEPLNVISTMLAPVGGVTDVRVVEPMRCLATMPGVVGVLCGGNEIPAVDAEAPRIFIFHRPAFIGANGFRVVEPLLERGFVVVTEFDDHPDYIPILQTPDMFNFTAVHAVQTTTPVLADILREQNGEVAVFPNGIRSLPNVANYVQRSYLTLFFGRINREQEWPPYMDALNAVAASAGGRLRFAVVRDSGFFDALQTPHKAFFPTVDYATYMSILSQCELSFMPLSDTPFNRCKSDLAFIEAGACRIAALASPSVYAESIQDGVTGVLFRDAAELRERLSALVENMDRARQIGDAARAWVGQHRMLAYQMASRVAWYRSLWARRAELNAALVQRIPELASAALGYGQPVA
jgi:glycosyltransferase involved in cell wall biosynthesis